MNSTNVGTVTLYIYEYEELKRKAERSEKEIEKEIIERVKIKETEEIERLKNSLRKAIENNSWITALKFAITTMGAYTIIYIITEIL